MPAVSPGMDAAARTGPKLSVGPPDLVSPSFG
jgi:hypothetical protein